MVFHRVLSWVRSQRRSCARRTGNSCRKLRLEALETRLTPSVDANAAFVASLYHGLLDRNVDSGGLAFWTGQLTSGVSRQQIVQGIEGSNEFVSREVQLFFKTLLGRDVDPAGLRLFGNALLTGTKVQQVKAIIMGSDEFFAHAGTSLSSFLNAAFRDELGRGLTATDQAFFASTPNTIAGRTTAAQQILNSAEATNVKVTGIFEQILGRRPDAAGLSFWTNQFNSGASDTAVVAGVAGSAEFFGGVQASAITTVTDPDTAASQFIVSRGLFNGVLPGVQELAGNISTIISLIIQPPPPAPSAVVTGNVAVAAFQGSTLSGMVFVTIATAGVSPTPIYFGATTPYQTSFNPPIFNSVPTPFLVAPDPNYQNTIAGSVNFPII